MQSMLAPMIAVVTPVLTRLDLAAWETNDELRFITSDRPCRRFDPEAYKRPPIYRAPALMYETIQITMPISPRQCLFLNRGGMTGYLSITPECLDELNRLTRFSAAEHFVVRRNRLEVLVRSWRIDRP